jgi:phosphoglycolate phosphatase
MTDASCAVAFDFDGTLVDSAPGIVRSLVLALEKNSIKPAVPVDEGLIGPPLPVLLARLVGRDDANRLDTLLADFRQCYDGGACLEARIYPGIETALVELRRRGYDLYLATNKPGVPTRQLLEHFGWTSLFCGLYCLDEQAGCDNKAQMLGRMLKTHGLAPQQTIYVGDTEGDACSAAIHGIPYIHVAWGYGGATDPSLPCTCGRPDNLISMIEHLARVSN